MIKQKAAKKSWNNWTTWVGIISSFQILFLKSPSLYFRSKYSCSHIIVWRKTVLKSIERLGILRPLSHVWWSYFSKRCWETWEIKDVIIFYFFLLTFAREQLCPILGVKGKLCQFYSFLCLEWTCDEKYVLPLLNWELWQ